MARGRFGRCGGGAFVPFLDVSRVLTLGLTPGHGSFGREAGVVGPAAVVRAHGAVLDRERSARDGVEHRTVVGDEQHRSRERLERLLERLAALEVEVVRRLVEDEEVRPGRDEQRE